MALQLIVVLICVLPIAVGIVMLRRLAGIPQQDRASAGWQAALIVLMTVDTLLVLGFLWAIAVFSCHGRYECPV